MNPQAIMTPGGIADQLTNGLSGVAMAFQRAREQRERREQTELENSRADSYLRIAQQNAQTGSNRQQYDFARQGRLDQAQVESDTLANHYKQQENERLNENQRMAQIRNAEDSGYGAGRPLQPGMSSLAQGIGRMSGMPDGGNRLAAAMQADRFPEQNQTWRANNDIKQKQLALNQTKLANEMRRAAEKEQSMKDPEFNAVLRQVAASGKRAMTDEEVVAATGGLDRQAAIAGGFAKVGDFVVPMNAEEVYEEAHRILATRRAKGQAPPPAELGAQGALPVPGAPAWLDSLDAKTR